MCNCFQNIKLFFKESNQSICLRDPLLLPRGPPLSACRSHHPGLGRAPPQGRAGSGCACRWRRAAGIPTHTCCPPQSPGGPLGWSQNPAELPARPPGSAGTPALPSLLPAPLQQARLAVLQLLTPAHWKPGRPRPEPDQLGQ